MKPLDLTSFARVPHTGATCLLTNFCMAAIKASKSTPRSTVARLKHAMVGTWASSDRLTFFPVFFLLMNITSHYLAGAPRGMKRIGVQVILPGRMQATRDWI